MFRNRDREKVAKLAKIAMRKKLPNAYLLYYTLILYHPRVYNMFHPSVLPHGPTPMSHPSVLPHGPTSWSHPRVPFQGSTPESHPTVPPRVPLHGPTLGSRILGPTPGCRSHFSGMPMLECKTKSSYINNVK